MKQTINIAQQAEPEKAVLVGLVTPQQDEVKSTEYLAELAFRPILPVLRQCAHLRSVSTTPILARL